MILTTIFVLLLVKVMATSEINTEVFGQTLEIKIRSNCTLKKKIAHLQYCRKNHFNVQNLKIFRSNFLCNSLQRK